MSRWAMCCVRGPSSSTGRSARARINGQPEHLLRAAQPGAPFVQLEVREPEGAEAALMEDPSMFACASEPRRDGGLPIALRPVGLRKDPALRPAQPTRRRSGGKGFSAGTRGCGAWK
jgi:hypothetical protein